MKQLTDTELKDFVVSLLVIEEHEQKMRQDCERNGFYNTPTECEDVECKDCPFDPNTQTSRGCPYVD